MRKKYEKPSVEIAKFKAVDFITVSGLGGIKFVRGTGVNKVFVNF